MLNISVKQVFICNYKLVTKNEKRNVQILQLEAKQEKPPQAESDSKPLIYSNIYNAVVLADKNEKFNREL